MNLTNEEKDFLIDCMSLALEDNSYLVDECKSVIKSIGEKLELESSTIQYFLRNVND
ncbi:hypothetical protein NHI66_003500 [Clostridium botulinum]|nr:hypothetical protein [Clostridium botulinum]